MPYYNRFNVVFPLHYNLNVNDLLLPQMGLQDFFAMPEHDSPLDEITTEAAGLWARGLLVFILRAGYDPSLLSRTFLQTATALKTVETRDGIDAVAAGRSMGMHPGLALHQMARAICLDEKGCILFHRHLKIYADVFSVVKREASKCKQRPAFPVAVHVVLGYLSMTEQAPESAARCYESACRACKLLQERERIELCLPKKKKLASSDDRQDDEDITYNALPLHRLYLLQSAALSLQGKYQASLKCLQDADASAETDEQRSTLLRFFGQTYKALGRTAEARPMLQGYVDKTLPAAEETPFRSKSRNDVCEIAYELVDLLLVHYDHPNMKLNGKDCEDVRKYFNIARTLHETLSAGDKRSLSNHSRIVNFKLSRVAPDILKKRPASSTGTVTVGLGAELGGGGGGVPEAAAFHVGDIVEVISPATTYYVGEQGKVGVGPPSRERTAGAAISVDFARPPTDCSASGSGECEREAAFCCISDVAVTDGADGTDSLTKRPTTASFKTEHLKLVCPANQLAVRKGSLVNIVDYLFADQVDGVIRSVLQSLLGFERRYGAIDLLIDELALPGDKKHRLQQTLLDAAVSIHDEAADGCIARLACRLAWKIGDGWSLFDAIDNAIRCKNLDLQMYAPASRCFMTLKENIHKKLSDLTSTSSLEEEDVADRLYEAAELAYAYDVELRCSESSSSQMGVSVSLSNAPFSSALEMLCRNQLRHLLRRRDESGTDAVVFHRTLRAAMLACQQYGQTQLSEFEEAQRLLDKIQMRGKGERLEAGLKRAIATRDALAIVGVINECDCVRRGSRSSLSAIFTRDQQIAAETRDHEIVIPKILEDALQALSDVVGSMINSAILLRKEDVLRLRIDQVRKLETLLGERSIKIKVDVESIMIDGKTVKLESTLSVDAVEHADQALIGLAKLSVFEELEKFVDEVKQRSRLTSPSDENGAKSPARNGSVDWKVDMAVLKPLVNKAMDVLLTAKDRYLDALKVFRDSWSLPSDWDVEKFVERTVWKPEYTTSLQIVVFQGIVDATFNRIYTRDRGGGAVPSGLDVVRVVAVQNPENYLKYSSRRDEIFEDVTNCKQFDCLATDDARGVKTFKAQKTWADALGRETEPIDPYKNEFYLWHGTKPEAADAITDSDFRLDKSGSNKGTLYGRGLYFAECCSKSDEYTEPNNEGLRALLLCRVACGIVKYTDTSRPSAWNLVRACTEGEYHSVLGDRERCRKTFREFVVYDSDQAYPEYIVWYRRRDP